MDAEHRHELRDNDLVKWIKQTPAFLRENLFQVIGVCCILLGVWLWMAKPFAGIREKSALTEHSKVTETIQNIEIERMKAVQSGITDQQTATTLITDSQTLEKAASDAGTDGAAALALIKSAEALRTDLHYSAGITEREIVVGQIEKARKSYEKALSKARGNATLTGMALFGLAICEEEVGNYDAAKQKYDEIAADESLAGTPWPATASKRIAAMSDNQRKYDFVDKPEPVVVEDVVGPVMEEAVEVVEEAVIEELVEEAVKEAVEDKEEADGDAEGEPEQDNSDEKVQE